MNMYIRTTCYAFQFSGYFFNVKKTQSSLLFFRIIRISALPIYNVLIGLIDHRMDLWLKRLETELERLTSGINDITMASQFSNVYQKAFDDGVGYTIETPRGEVILSSMVNKISGIFEKNVEALKVHTTMIWTYYVVAILEKLLKHQLYKTLN